MQGESTKSAGTGGFLQWPWYPYVVAIYPLWYVYLRNLGQAQLSSVLAATLVMLVVTALLSFSIGKLARSRILGALVTCILLGAFYSYGALHDGLVRFSRRASLPSTLKPVVDGLTDHLLLSLVLALAVAAVLVLVIRRVSRQSTRLTSACNFAAMVLGALLLVRVVTGAWQYEQVTSAIRRAPDIPGKSVSVLGYNPDIYYIVLDGYARADVLDKYYGFDDTEFIDALRERRFTVSDASRTNYYWTFISLASSLNFAYLQDFAAPIIDDPRMSSGRVAFGAVSTLIQGNRAADFLRKRGYRFVHLNSSSPETVRNPFADEQVGCKGRMFDDEYFRAVAEVSWLQALGSLAASDLAECHQERLRALGDQARRPGPKFVFAHFLPPHHPYLFDRHGNVLKRVTLSNQFDFQARLWENKQAYIGQLRYVNATMLQVIDRILAESERPPVIILASDHGPNLREGLSPSEAVNLRLANFAAYLLPGELPAAIPADAGPVNQFRYIFNLYFDAGLPILPDRSFYSEFRSPLKFREVVNRRRE